MLSFAVTNVSSAGVGTSGVELPLIIQTVRAKDLPAANIYQNQVSVMGLRECSGN
jgi:hypothetical protein